MSRDAAAGWSAVRKEDLTPKEIDVNEIRSLIDRGAQVVDVLPADEYEEEHLPAAVNIPLKLMTADATGVLDHRRPVIVYCWDYQ
jgi:rhodanese-related sulfurtransferase